MWQEVHLLEGSNIKSTILTSFIIDNKFICGNTDATITLWDLNSLKQTATLTGHTREILTLTVGTMSNDEEGQNLQQILISASADNTIRLWNLKELKCLGIIVGHAGNINAMCIYKYYLCIGCQDTSVKVIDLKNVLQQLNQGEEENKKLHITKTRAETLKAHHGYVYALTLVGHKLISSSGDGTIIVWNLKKIISDTNGELEQYVAMRDQQKTTEGELKIDTKGGAIYDIIADENIIISAGQDGKIGIWDIDTGYLRRVLSGHSNEILSLTQVKNGFFISSSSDGTMRIWEKLNFHCIQIIERKEKKSSILSSSKNFPLFFSSFQYKIRAFAFFANGENPFVRENQKNQISLNSNWKNYKNKYKKSPTSQPKESYDTNDENGKEDNQSILLLAMMDPLIIALSDFVKIKSISGDPRYTDDCWAAAKFLWRLFEQNGFESQIVEGEKGKNPLVLGRIGHDKNKKTVTVYGHYDVFPVKKAEWENDPFQLTGKNGYLYARGCSDDKGPILAILYAAAELQLAQCLPINLVFVIEGEEECNSDGLVQALSQYSSFFHDTDVVLLSNTVWLGENSPCLHYGLRGVLSISLTVSGPTKNLHSGIDGGIFREPMGDLVSLLSSINHSHNGNILIPGFYDDIREISEDELKLYEGVDFNIEEYKLRTGIEKLYTEDAKELLMKRWRNPSLSIHSIGTPNQYSISSVIPAAITCRLSVRFVPDQSAEALFDKIHTFLMNQFSTFNTGNKLEIQLLKSGEWWLADPSNKYFKAAEKALESVWKQKVVYSREGGTIPITNRLEKTFNAPAIHFPISQSTDSQHLADERIRLENLIKGKDSIKQFFINLAECV